MMPEPNTGPMIKPLSSTGPSLRSAPMIVPSSSRQESLFVNFDYTPVSVINKIDGFDHMDRKIR
ncbi:hypothetical protein JIR001_12450 [Polycladomyces abyssicola]|uniref:Uncharacterized protein n=1 Tax=Polycladomyces abyssicola TaxID=1125966 RepID=A0A8D5UDW3_9BACL|nr:hypothetical protein JIR001_12450 [Polycladomyces abyssicola]